MNDCLDFFRPHFDAEPEAVRFVKECERQSPPANTAKILMHQTQRLISLADQVLEIRTYDESLHVLFLIMCSENISKLQDGYLGDGKSRAYVRRFFERFLSQADKDILGDGFINNDDKLQRPLGFDRAVELLYDIRCDVVHEGNYIGFYFHDGKTPILNTNPNVTANLRLRDVRNIIVRGCIKAVQTRL